jgi:hypothetical protein
VTGLGQEAAGKSVGATTCLTWRGERGEREWEKGGTATTDPLYSRGGGREEGVRLGVPRGEGSGVLAPTGERGQVAR